MTTVDQSAPLPEDVFDDAGGVPFDDDFEVEEVGTRGGPPGVAHETAATMQQLGIAYPDSTPTGMVVLMKYLLGRWGGNSKGILNRRTVRGGTTPSMHSWGMALDWGWVGQGPGRAGADEAIEFLLANAPALGVQAVHDYVNTTYWKNNKGWQPAKVSSKTGFGMPWAMWLHVERVWKMANDPTPIEQLLGGSTPTNSPVSIPPPTPTPTNTSAGRPDSVPSSGGGSVLPSNVLKVGSEGADVAVLQDYLRFTGFATFAKTDGEFGAKTETSVKAAQTKFVEMKIYDDAIDGKWGKKSSAAGEEFLKRGGR